MMKFETEDYGSEKTILAFPDHYVAMPQYFEKDSALAVTVGDRKIIKGGTIYPSNDANAVGVVFQDLDVTNGDANGAVILHGFINVNKLPAAPTTAAIAALNNITFLPVKKTTIESDIDTVDTTDYANSKVIVTVYGTDLTAAATTASNWTVTDSNATNVVVSSVRKVDNRTAEITFATKAETTAKAGKFTISLGASAVANGVASNAITLNATV